MSKQQQQQMANCKPCPLCGKLGVEKVIEPQKRGILMKSVHDDGTACEFTLSSQSSFFKRNNPQWMKCPKCGDRGRINPYRARKNNTLRPDYIMVHEEIGGTWGKPGVLKRRRRCYLRTKEQRDAVVKWLGKRGGG